MKPAIVLFTNQLRLFDHAALYQAAETKKPLICVYLFDEEPKITRKLGSSHCWWLHHSLDALQKSFAKRKKSLVLRKGEPIAEIEKLIKESGADEVYANDSFDPLVRKENGMIQQKLRSLGVDFHLEAANLLTDPREIQPGSSRYFKVFTPFWKRCLELLDPSKPLPVPDWEQGPDLKSDDLSDWKLLDRVKCTQLDSFWKPGEEAARSRLQTFLSEGIKTYKTDRDRMDKAGTSLFSPYFRWGELSIREVWHAVDPKEGEAFLRELGFREFSYHLLYHFPGLPNKNFREQFDQLPWKKNPEALERWKEGKTGYPVVDAGMRQLQEIGWVHNRARMIVGSFLTKDLHLDWREGEEWFWDLLVDADPALNTFNWQWVAGSGADAAPYFRIFNPSLQAEKFDPDEEYVRKWVKELGNGNYPEPMVDHSVERKVALEMYEKVK